MKRKIAFIHTSPAAIGPLMQFYGAAAPELEITNLLDDGILRLFAAGNQTAAQARLAELLHAAREVYQVELAMITCSAVSKPVMAALQQEFAPPLLKIDEPMARQAVQAGRKIGVVVSFPPTLEPTCRLLASIATEAGGNEVELIREVQPDAYQALLAGDTQKHDELLLAAVNRLVEQDVNAVVLAQVSMARLLPRLEGKYAVPVLSSLKTSLAAIRAALPENRSASASDSN